MTSQQLRLADYMSEISERCYYAGWMLNLEYVLWNAVLNGPRLYGHSMISQEDIKILMELSKAANAWIILDDETERTAIDLKVWTQSFQHDIQKNPELLNG